MWQVNEAGFLGIKNLNHAILRKEGVVHTIDDDWFSAEKIPRRQNKKHFPTGNFLS
jgi:hypothetical protein